MADQSDVESALVALASAAVYPNGISAVSAAGGECRVYRGWPHPAALDADLLAGKINVTVFSAGGPGKTTTRYAEQWVGTLPQPSMTAAVSGDAVTFSGTAAPGQLAGILVDERSYVYRPQEGDTPELVAASLAAMARDAAIVQLHDATLTIPGAGKLCARVVTDAAVQCEVRRQQQTFRISCWCATPSARDATAAAIDQAFASMTFIALIDGSQAHLRYSGTEEFDQSQDARLYRRDLLYDIEYPTVLSATQPAMLFGNLNLNAASFTA
jgi:hypothetical protein